MRGKFNPAAEVLNARSDATSSANIILLFADTSQFWVLQKLWVSNEATGTDDFDVLASRVIVDVVFGATVRWSSHLHPGNGGTGSLEFENGPWEFDFSPGLYMGTKNEGVTINVGTFGTGMSSSMNILYQ